MVTLSDQSVWHGDNRDKRLFRDLSGFLLSPSGPAAPVCQQLGPLIQPPDLLGQIWSASKFSCVPAELMWRLQKLKEFYFHANLSYIKTQKAVKRKLVSVCFYKMLLLERSKAAYTWGEEGYICAVVINISPSNHLLAQIMCTFIMLLLCNAYKLASHTAIPSLAPHWLNFDQQSGRFGCHVLLKVALPLRWEGTTFFFQLHIQYNMVLLFPEFSSRTVLLSINRFVWLSICQFCMWTARNKRQVYKSSQIISCLKNLFSSQSLIEN